MSDGKYYNTEYSETLQLTREQLNRHWVVPASITVRINGKTQVLGVCQAENNNYIRIRDIAMLLNGTEKSFDFGEYNSILVTSTPYTPTGVEYKPSPLSSGQMCAKTNFDFLPMTPKEYQYLLDHPTAYDMTPHADAYNFNNTNFVKLRDIAKELDFYVGWDAASGAILIDTARGYSS